MSYRSMLRLSLIASLTCAVACHAMRLHRAQALTYSLEGVAGWPNQAHYDAAAAAAASSIARYNAYGNFNNITSNVYIYYEPGIPTAQANFGGSIGFGGTYPAERVMMHEMAHFLGLPSGNWNSLISGGWSGPRGAALIQQFDGVGAVINGDGAHFWPYGLNYDSEGSEINKQRQVALVYAMRADLGIGPAAHPSTATVVTLTGDDPFGTSGFNYKDRWSDGYFAHSGAAYSTEDFLLRTPASSASFTFAGDSLRINNTNGSSGGLLYKGTGVTGVTKINNLILDGGYVRHANGAGDRFLLDGGITLIGNPTIDAAQGHIEVLASITGAGAMNLRSNGYSVTLANSNNAYSGPTVVESGTLVVAGSTGYGVTTVTGRGLLGGGGVVRGDLIAQGGSVVRVGAAGLPSMLPFTVIDDFEGYATGDVRDVAAPPWTAHQNTSYVDIEADGGNQYLAYGWQSDFRGASRGLSAHESIGDGTVATFFFRVNSKSATIDHNFGLGDQASTTAVSFGDFEAQLRMKSGSQANTFAIDARDGGGFSTTLASDLALNTWYNVWMVVDQASDTYDLYLNSGATGATAGDKLNSSPLSFRNGTASALNQVLALAGTSTVDNAVRIDDLVHLPGVDLAYPLSATPILAGESLTVQGHLDLQAGATLAMDLFSPSVHDILDVQGDFLAAGTLQVSLDAAATPLEGDVFDLFEVGGAMNGSFASLQLPGLSAGLAWDVTDLLATGELAVVADLDWDDDGDVDGRDFLLTQRVDPSLSPKWEALWGAQIFVDSAASATQITAPEPPAVASALLALITACGATWKRKR